MKKEITGFTLAGCFMIILTSLLNLLLWGGLIYLVFWCLQHFGIIGG